MNIFNRKKEPRILIQHGFLIDPVIKFYTQNHPDTEKMGWHTWIAPSKEELDKRIDTFRAEWEKYSIAKKISKTLGLSFRRDVIDVFVVSGAPRASSHPIIVSSTQRPREFVVTLAEELIHRILTINEIPRVVYDENESSRTNNHVIVYAIFKKILDEELWDIAITPKGGGPTNQEYVRARELAEKIGPDRVINKMRTSRNNQLVRLF